jgi:hypothetical protein
MYGQWASDTRLPVWREHALRSYADTDDAFLFSDNQYRFLKDGDVMLRGGAFEIGRRFYREHMHGLDIKTATGRAVLVRFPQTSDLGGGVVAALDEWLYWRKNNPIGLDLIDSFYLDQRWAAGNHHLPGDILHPANSMTSFSALLSPDPVDRQSGLLQNAIIQKLCPDLLHFPINSSPSRLDRAAQFTLRLGRKGRKLLRRALFST